jgi:hypothetical protein
MNQGSKFSLALQCSKCLSTDTDMLLGISGVELYICRSCWHAWPPPAPSFSWRVQADYDPYRPPQHAHCRSAVVSDDAMDATHYCHSSLLEQAMHDVVEQVGDRIREIIARQLLYGK